MGAARVRRATRDGTRRRPEPASKRAALLMQELQRHQGSAGDIERMARFGIRSSGVLGVHVPTIRRIARQFGHNHGVAARLWASGVFEGRMLAAMVDEPLRVTERQMDDWAGRFDNWAICDGVCQDLFCHTPFAMAKARQWSRSPSEYVKRAGFSMVAGLALSSRGHSDRTMRSTFGILQRGADDDRPSVRKGVSWALRQIGKRSPPMRLEAVEVARQIARRGTRGARWVASDVLRELENPKIRRMVRLRASRQPRAIGSRARRAVRGVARPI
ncbi:MAG: DNA alkylation repair protein [Thermoplasmata archaeon]|nr:DNA alkylation repair protein [Thermoplasmata archaeon]